ncbi:MAG TPA: divergent polysaccharide deacetylase family protein [Candidatus Limnocylindria bacterium]|nr:divergent polysaccharide deacetylase family protein [Candidatus Limnocylindria bacterium]
MLCAFLAGLVTIGLAVLMPGGESRNPAEPPSQGEPEAPAAIPPGSTQPSAKAMPAEVPIPRLAIVVDDNGYDTTRDAEWLKFPEKITLAVIPFGPSSRRLAKAAHERGFGVLIHIPMEPASPVSDRTDGFRLRRGMGREEMDALLDRMVEENSWATGVSNHMGSAFTADPESMATFAALLKSRGLFFLDSMTTSRSVAVQAAVQAGIPVARRDLFFDTYKQPEEMRLQWKRALSIAKKKGKAVLVCHGRKESLRVILDLVPDLEAEGVRAVTLDELFAREQSG